MTYAAGDTRGLFARPVHNYSATSSCVSGGHCNFFHHYGLNATSPVSVRSLPGSGIHNKAPAPEIERYYSMVRSTRLILLFLLAFAMFAMSSVSRAQVAVGVSIRIGPPALPVYPQPICPGPGYIWTPGYWAYGPADTTGFLARGYSPRQLASSGRRAIGAGLGACTSGMPAIGALMWAFMAELPMGSVTPEWALSVAPRLARRCV